MRVVLLKVEYSSAPPVFFFSSLSLSLYFSLILRRLYLCLLCEIDADGSFIFAFSASFLRVLFCVLICSVVCLNSACARVLLFVLCSYIASRVVSLRVVCLFVMCGAFLHLKSRNKNVMISLVSVIYLTYVFFFL